VFAIVLGAYVTAIALVPTLSAAASGPFDESNAYSETFTVTNIGVLPLEDVNIGIGPCALDTEKSDFYVSPNNCSRDIPYMLIGDPAWEAPELARNEPFSVTLTDQMNEPTDKYRAVHPKVIASWKTLSKLKGANVVVVVSYRPWPLPANIHIPYILTSTRMTRGFRFVAAEQPNDKVMWKPVPLSWRPDPKGTLNAP
jgi:hypothetical protein